MIHNGRLLALIPARSGSKRLPNKNTLNLAGKPLIAWSIEAGLQSKYVDRVVVSTDSNSIADISREYGADVPFMRPDELSTDYSKTIDVVLNTLDLLKRQKDCYEYILLLQPTSPLRTAYFIDEAVELLKSNKANGVVGVTEVGHPVEWSNTLPSNHSLRDFIPEKYKGIRSQDFPKRYTINGAIYLNKTKNVEEECTLLLNNGSYAYLMPQSVSLDIDSKFDFEMAEFLLTNNIKRKPKS